MFPHNNGLIGLSHRGFRINDYHKHIGFLLKKYGYTTAVAGTEHIANHGLFAQHDMDYNVLPYDVILGPPAEDNDIENAGAVADYIKGFNEKSGKFFISFGLWNTHRVYPDEITEGYEPEYVKVPATMKDTAENRNDFAHYCTSVKIVDQCFKIIIDALKERGIYDETLIIFTTDHGLASPFMKSSLTDEGIGVALIMRVPGMNQSAKVIDAMVSQIDLFPTICDILKIEKPDWLQGISQLPVIKGETKPVRDRIYAETNYHASFEPMRCIRTEKYKYIKVFHDYKNPMLANIDNSKPKELLLEQGFKEYTLKQEYLFDLIIDPCERVNLIHNDRYKDTLRYLSEELKKHMVDTKDILLNGEVRHPAGIAINAPEALSPKDNPIITA
jgi:arylsulfatase A-like enzyme